MSTALVWFRRELRVSEQPALRAASEGADLLVPVFCLDDRLLHGRHASPGRTQFLLDSLVDLDRSLRERGSGLVLRHGDPACELVKLALATGAETVHACVDAGPFARRRDHAVAASLNAAGVALRGHGGVFAVDDLEALRGPAGNYFTVFTPFHRAWLAAPRRAVHPAPERLPSLPEDLERGRVPSLDELGLRQTLSAPARGGERAGTKSLEAFLDRSLSGYRSGHNELGDERCSRLSPYLHLGCVSPRSLEQRLPQGRGAEAFRRQLAWRDFYAHVLRAHPGNARHEHQARYRGRIRWAEDATLLDAWRDGRTGYPLVDAGMRQLRVEGWMHNRVRLVVGSFLTKDLGLDWRLGERHFMSLLLDGDEASNNGSWQWVASVGVDPQPVFKRILSPARQQARFDPHGTYVRRWLPELRAVPDQHLTEPWRMPAALQREIGCVIGTDYPAPVVDHLQARRAALERYSAAA